MKRLPLNQVDRRLCDIVKGGHGFGVCLVAALRNDQLRELRGYIHVGLFESASAQRPAATSARRADVCRARVEAGQVVVGSVANQSLLVLEGSQSDLAQGIGLTIAENALD